MICRFLSIEATLDEMDMDQTSTGVAEIINLAATRMDTLRLFRSGSFLEQFSMKALSVSLWCVARVFVQVEQDTVWEQVGTGIYVTI